MLCFSTHFHSLTAHYTTNYLLPTSNLTWNAPCSTSQAHELSDDSAQHEALHTAADPSKKLEEQWVIPRTGVIPSLYSRGNSSDTRLNTSGL